MSGILHRPHLHLTHKETEVARTELALLLSLEGMRTHDADIQASAQNQICVHHLEWMWSLTTAVPPPLTAEKEKKNKGKGDLTVDHLGIKFLLREPSVAETSVKTAPPAGGSARSHLR